MGKEWDKGSLIFKIMHGKWKGEINQAIKL